MLIDIGANLTHESFNEDRNDVVKRARDAGVNNMIITGASRQGSHDAATIAAQYDGFYATAGIHPHHAGESTAEVMAEVRLLASDPTVRAVGETGLDFFRDFCPRKTQETSFEAHLALAVELNMPMFLHERDAYPRFAEMLATARADLPNVVVHCFTGDKQALHHYLDMDCHIGITGWICDERRGYHLHELINDIPANRLMIETDSPYLMPRHIRPKPKSRRNEPLYLAPICDYIANLRGVEPAILAAETTATAQQFFGI